MTFSIVAAVSTNGLIGVDGSIPWRLSEEMKLFKRLTMGKTIVYGKNTWGKNFPLQGRTNIMLSRSASPIDGVQIYRDLDSFLREAPSEEIMIIGGGNVYAQFMSGLLIDKIYLSVVDLQSPASSGKKVYFPFEKKDSTFMFGNLEYAILRADRHVGFTSYVLKYINPVEKKVLQKYSDLVYRVGSFDKISRAGPCTTIFANNEFCVDVSRTFPLMGFRKQFFKGMVAEVLYYVSGETDTKILEAQGVDVWKANTSRAALDKYGFADYQEGEMGPSYGFQFRHAGAAYPSREGGVDQLAEAIHAIKHDPDSRRIIISLWDAKAISQMVLPPCLNYYQFLVNGEHLILHAHMRSSDFALAGNWNIASSALLLYLVAYVTGLKPSHVVWNAVDLHLYDNQRESLKELLSHDCLGTFPRLIIDGPKNIDDLRKEHIRLVDYNCTKKVKLAMNP